jgi:hypothetical protein
MNAPFTPTRTPKATSHRASPMRDNVPACALRPLALSFRRHGARPCSHRPLSPRNDRIQTVMALLPRLGDRIHPGSTTFYFAP